MTALHMLAQQVGFHLGYHGFFNNWVTVNDDALTALLTAMGYDVSSPQAMLDATQALQYQSWLRLLPASQIINEEDEKYQVTVSVKASDLSEWLSWRFDLETGQVMTGRCDAQQLSVIEQRHIDNELYLRLTLPLPKIDQGYHRLSVALGKQQAQCYVIVAPKMCLVPSDIADYRMWGLAVQLYSLKSQQSWGIGDFGDLRRLVNGAASQGIAAIGLNPLHPLFPANPNHISPYSPSSRSFYNVSYIDVCSVDNFSDCQAAQQLVHSEEFQQHLARANQAQLVDYSYAAHLKQQVLELLYQDFVDNWQDSDFAMAYRDFICTIGDDLLALATFDALHEHFQQQDGGAHSWQSWPLEYQDYHSASVLEFQQQHIERIGYFQFLQFIAERQLAKVAKDAKQHGMPIGLYLDLAVGCDGGGADVWADKHSYVAGVSIGAPPDAMNRLGQSWGLTPMNPVTLQEQGYQPLVKALRSNMRHAGALRIDHILGLLRQYWVAPGMAADQGVYISFPVDDIFRIIALESHRNRCVVVGEDLGNIPDGFRAVMAKAGLLSYRVLPFERWPSGLFFRPEIYPELAMATVATHDLPPLLGWWHGNDLDWRQKLNLYPNQGIADEERHNRTQAKQQLLAALEFEGLLLTTEDKQATRSISQQCLVEAVQRFLARTPSAMLMVPLEDALNLTEQVNIPGTVDEHPNWRRRMPYKLDELWSQQSLQQLIKIMTQERPKSST
ncbi:4-alpha-glucanotransferase [Thalassotalea maritima]|uniref:4-alpha-glucanotransferase n=1 Tax=Thalassotalea maritima TaxID=3242416 RepID=UPI003527896B